MLLKLLMSPSLISQFPHLHHPHCLWSQVQNFQLEKTSKQLMCTSNGCARRVHKVQSSKPATVQIGNV